MVWSNKGKVTDDGNEMSAHLRANIDDRILLLQLLVDPCLPYFGSPATGFPGLHLGANLMGATRM